MLSHITNGPCQFLFEDEIMGKHVIKYYRCKETGFIQTEKPHWLAEAYSNAIATLDIGLVGRNVALSEFTAHFLSLYQNPEGEFVDYGGGYGMFVRLLRDQGYNFKLHEPNAPNLFAEHFAVDAAQFDAGKYELITAFEVFEHVEKPAELLALLLAKTDNVLFSTELQPPEATFTSNQDWWYFARESGQHISLYTESALTYLARQHGCHYSTNGQNLHLISRKPHATNPFRRIEKLNRLQQKLNAPGRYFLKTNGIRTRPSLLMSDYAFIKTKLSTHSASPR